MSNFTIRALTTDDLPGITSIHIKAFPGRAFTDLGSEAIYRYYDWQLQGPYESVCEGIFQDGSLLGYCFSGVFRNSLAGFLKKNGGFLILRVITHPWLVFSSFFRGRIALAVNHLRRVPSASLPKAVSRVQSFGILVIAVNPDWQGWGLGKKLMHQAEERARNQGFSRMRLTVDPKNIQAITFYKKLEWEKKLTPDGFWRGSMFKTLKKIT
jgi:ribosomal protein S18 acetylase RimI-like enzyme